MTKSASNPYINKWGDEILGEHIEHAVSSTDSAYDSQSVWQLQRVPERDYERREYGREFVLVRLNANRSQSFRAGEFTRETARALRDMLNAALAEETA
jgi:hypothetical protein